MLAIVRSIDLDTWSDDQIKMLVKWGNKRANLYWEAKLPPNYAPDDSKIDNFIRTKYEMRRWVLSDQLPEDPSVLDNLANKRAGPEEDTVPLSEVQRRLVTTPKKRGSVSSSTMRGNSISSGSGSRSVPPIVDLLGGADLSAAPTTSTQRQNVVSGPGGRVSMEKSQLNAAARPSVVTRGPPASKPQTADLLGLDFGAPAPEPSHSRNASAASTSAGTSSPVPAGASAPATPVTSRPDLTKSILSLYSSTPIQPQQANSAQTNTTNTFGTFQSNNFGGFASPSPTMAKPSADPFSSFQSPAPRQGTAVNGGAQKSNGLDSLSFLTGNLNLGAATTTTTTTNITTTASATKSTANALDGLFSTTSNANTGWSMGSTAAAPIAKGSIPSVTHDSWTTTSSTMAASTIPSPNNNNSAAGWNLSAWDTKPAATASWATGNEGWGSTSAAFAPANHNSSNPANDDEEWDDFMSTGPNTSVPVGIKSTDDDLFSNVWK
ncbi:hypothetical protein D0Z00_003455 [Geotrichum galactomycetum]|uniref:Uncharacterized protein n=1 Tax=Geotrichum galactomycetum TaxID=27317 RepID=A0ACB6V1D4_9ASCO|nr:hypothetical protein D0Z00_003455 [Geotrichum candidum]